MAPHDGQVLHVHACCDIDITVGVTEFDVAHDDGCPAVDPAHPFYYAARALAMVSVAAAVERLTGEPVLALLQVTES